MNARKKKKRLKKQIERLKYERYLLKHVNIKRSCVRLAEFEAVWQIPEATGVPNDQLMDYAKERLAKELLDDILEAGLIDYDYYPNSCIKASILVGRKE